ncbi:MAG TPA: YigZ family protein [Spirochaetota bacterium]|nr:YigZ family protein [Spirochaetota bacterium]
MFVIENESEIEIIEKKSKFITRSKIVYSEKEVEEHLAAIKKNEKGATHNCYAYRILQRNTIIERKNDDGEPGGTAGSPMLAVLTGENIVNILAITTRYFGGIKLGSGGLVNNYKKGVVEVIKKSGKKELKIQSNYEIKFKISETHRIEYILKKEDVKIYEKKFNGEEVVFKIICEDKTYEKIRSCISQ